MKTDIPPDAACYEGAEDAYVKCMEPGVWYVSLSNRGIMEGTRHAFASSTGPALRRIAEMGANAPKSFDAAFRSIQRKKERLEAAKREQEAKDAIPLAATGAPKVDLREFTMRTTESNFVKFLTERGNRKNRQTGCLNADQEVARSTRQKL